MAFAGANTLMGLPTGRYDGHVHVFTADLPMVEGRRYTPDYDATPEALCRLLARHGLDGALLVQPSFLGADNRYLLRVLQRYSGQSDMTFRGVVVLDPQAPVDVGLLKDLDQLGVVGVRLNLVRQAGAFSYDTWQATLAEIETLGWHVEVHCESEYLERILPELTARHRKVVIDHYGLVRSDSDDRGFWTIVEQPAERIWIKLSAAYRTCPEAHRREDAERMLPLRQRYAEVFGSDRLIWGSDWPFTQFEDQVTYEHTLALSS